MPKRTVASPEGPDDERTEMLNYLRLANLLSRYFVTFPQLVRELFQSQADRSDQEVLKRYRSYDCLVIDEVGYVEVEPAQVGQFFTLMHQRHKQKTTLITSNLGFSEWSSFLKNKQLTAALIDRLTENSHLFNIKNDKTLRDPLDE